MVHTERDGAGRKAGLAGREGGLSRGWGIVRGVDETGPRRSESEEE